MYEGYMPLLITFIVAVVILYLMLWISRFLGPHKDEKYKRDTYECGEVTKGSTAGPIRVQYYLVLLIFVIFDVEMIFLIPWASYLKNLGLIAIYEGFTFIVMLIIALFYAFKKGYMEWR